MIKKRKAQLIISLIVFLLSLLGLFMVIFINASEKDPDKKKEVLLSIDSSAVRRLETVSVRNSYILERPDKDNSIWYLKSDEREVNNEKVNAMLSAIERVTSSKIIRSPLNWNDYGSAKIGRASCRERV